MRKRIFVSATNTDIGKTYTTKLLLQELSSRGLAVAVIKPIETGVIEKRYPDGEELLSIIKGLNPLLKDLEVEDIVPISYELPAAPFVASGVEKIDFKKIDKAVEKLEELCDVLVFEGAGGLMVPLDEDYMLIDLIKLYQAQALLVTHCSLGCINDTLLSKMALEKYEIPHIIAFNCRKEDDDFSKVSEPYFLHVDFDVLKVDENIDTICDVLYNL